MGRIWVRELTGGLDGRRMPETTSGAVLLKAENGHITRGGEFEKRQAFQRKYVLPAGVTFGLAADANSLYVFGKDASPVGLPAGVLYQRLIHPTTPSLQVASIKSFDLNAGKIYVIAQFSDNSRHMYYDGVYVDSWSNGFAKGWFRIETNEITRGHVATGALQITGGSNDVANKITSIKVNGENLLGTPVQHTGANGSTAIAVAAGINAYTGTSGYTAARSGWRVTITAPSTGTAFNDEAIVSVVTGDFTVNAIADFSGGTNDIVPSVDKIWVGRTKILNTTVLWTTTAVQMAIDVAAAIDAYSGTSGYTATAFRRRVIVTATSAGDEPNGEDFRFRAEPGFGSFDFEDTRPMSGGTTKSLPKGTFLRTINTKVYAVAGDVLHFSGIAAPTSWTTDNVGAGFIDMSSIISGTENLKCLATYENYIAIFGETSTVIEYVDPDPSLNKLSQVIQNTGTIAPLSVTHFGNSDLFYLDSSGIRSLRARDSSNSASTTDTGVAVDDLITAKLATMSASERANVIGAIEPVGNRFWLAMKDVIYVFSYFSGAKVSAWTTYVTKAFISGTETAFNVDYMTVFDRRVYIRDDDAIYIYGDTDDDPVYDATEASAWTPYLDANDPTRKKQFTGLDAAVEGVWNVAAAMDPLHSETEDEIGNLTGTSYNHDRIPMDGAATHISIRFRSTDPSAARLASLCVVYEGDEIEDR